LSLNKTKKQKAFKSSLKTRQIRETEKEIFMLYI